MKKKFTKFISALVICATVTSTIVGSMPFNTTVYATVTEQTKTATLKDIKVSFDGNETVTIQSYVVDGDNYVRVDDVAKHLNMKVVPIASEVGNVLIAPDRVYDSEELDKLTQHTVSATLAAGKIYYSGKGYPAQRFECGDYYYYRLVDIAAASESALASSINYTEQRAKNTDFPDIAVKTFKSVKLELDSEIGITKVISINTNLQKIFDDIRNAPNFEMVTPYRSVENPLPILESVSNTTQIMDVAPTVQSTKTTSTSSIKSEKTEPLPIMTKAPEVGVTLANILIDETKEAYKTDGTVNLENFTEIYRNTMPTSSIGGCNWYAISRLREVTGINMYQPEALAVGWSYSNVVGKAKAGLFIGLTGVTDVKGVVPRSIAVYKSHVVFIEYVERDANGNPLYVYTTEANRNHDGTRYKKDMYYPEFDCKVRKRTYEEFINHKSNGNPLLGYIVAK